MHSYSDIFENKKKILFVTAHPDDVDAFWAGTIAKLTKDGKEVFVLVVTSGARGSREHKISERKLAKIRRDEQINALAAVGVPSQNYSTLGYKDGEAENGMKLIGEIAYFIRKIKPDLVSTHDPQNFYSDELKDSYINHRDHRVTGMSTLDAIYPFSRDLSFFPKHRWYGLTPHIVNEVLLMGDKNTKIDITDVIEIKKKALEAHTSQFDEETIKGLIDWKKQGNKYFETGTYFKLSW